MNSITLRSVYRRTKQAFHKYGWQYLGSTSISIILNIIIILLIIYLISNTAIVMWINLIINILPMKTAVENLAKDVIKLLVVIGALKLIEYLFNQGSMLSMIDSGSNKITKKQVCLGFLKLFSNKKLLIGVFMIGLLKIALAYIWVIVPIILEIFLIVIKSTSWISSAFVLIIIGAIIANIKAFKYSMATYMYYQSLRNNKPIGYLKALELSDSRVNGHKRTLFWIEVFYIIFVAIVIYLGYYLMLSMLSSYVQIALLLVAIAVIFGAIFAQVSVAILEYIILNQKHLNHKNNVEKLNRLKHITNNVSKNR